MASDLEAWYSGGIPGVIFNNERRKEANRTNAANRDAVAAQNAENVAHQKEFAQMGIQWRVEDAKKAGIHPLYALGAQTTGFTPSSHVFQESNSAPDISGPMGQDISRAVMASQSIPVTEMQKLAITSAQLDIEGKYIENAIRATQLQKLQSPGSPPGVPLPDAIQGGLAGQGDAVRVRPAEPTASQSGRPAQEAGAINSFGYTRDTDTSYGIAPSKDMKERIEDDLIGETLWHIRNRINPPPPDPKQYPIPEHLRRQGYKYWFWNPLKQQFVPSKNP